MSCNKEIGGYFSLECGNTPLYHKEGLWLNSGRNALRHIIRLCRIRKIYVPSYTCPVVKEALSKENCEIIFYPLNLDFTPAVTFPDSAFVLYNNYFGVCGQLVRSMAERYPNLIVDNAQSFYSSPLGLASFYSPRKFFGLPDGGLAWCKTLDEVTYPADKESDLRCSHLLARPLRGAAAGYGEFCKNDTSFDELEIMQMSSLTRCLMGNIDYERVRSIRLKNFQVLHQLLEPEKQWDLAEDDVPMVYPYCTDAPDLREYLIKQHIFVATYWPGVSPDCHYLQSHILPLPLDQRYDTDDMKYIAHIIKSKK